MPGVTLYIQTRPHHWGSRIHFSIEFVEAQISRLSGLAFRLLAFPRDLEQHLEDKTGVGRCKRLWLEGLLAIVLFDIALLLEHLFAAEPNTKALIVRVSVITPLALIVNCAMLFRPTKLYRETSIALFACLAALVELSMQSNLNALHTAYAQFTATAMLVFANTVIRLRFIHAVAASAVVAAAEIYFCRIDTTLPPGTRLLGLVLSLSVTFLTLVANYSLNREERLNFLLCLRGDLLIEKLSHANQELGLAAEVDGLTGLANRYAFDRKLMEVWQDAKEKGQVVSVILIDVDHFKLLNDKFGHLYGDKVLKRVALLLSESLRRKEDFVARFGGEEFVIVLPATVGDQALLVAERLRKLVEVAGFPALETPSGVMRNIRATVSCGVASESPIVLDDPYFLIDAADKALYQAKAQGRNAVRVAANAELPRRELQEVGA